MKNIGLYLPLEEIERVKKEGATFCQPKVRVEALEPGLVQKTIVSVGKVFDVADEEGKVRAQARLTDAFITTFGSPDARLLEGYGFKGNVVGFQDKCREFWHQQFPDSRLSEKTELFVIIYSPV